MEHLDELYELCEFLDRDLKEMNEKVRAAGGKINNDTLSYLDKLAHTMKSVKTVIAMEEAQENGYSERDRSYGRSSYGQSYGGSYDGDSGSSYARGRGSNAKRDSMGRYSRDGYSRNEGYSRDDHKQDMMRKLSDVMQSAQDEHTRSELANIMNMFDRM